MDEDEISLEIWEKLGPVVGALGHPSAVYISVLDAGVRELAREIMAELQSRGWKEPPQEYLNEKIALFIEKFVATPEELQKEKNALAAIESAQGKLIPLRKKEEPNEQSEQGKR
jgi:hypothetical protein